MPLVLQANFRLIVYMCVSFTMIHSHHRPELYCHVLFARKSFVKDGLGL
ncbi:uncharacterized protein METZ01_LOCUS328319 [marine metagenome]|uniref:Uncharacterized protein n=1 Tax=marine metagenome TaxID=408172 RepID=A0A382PS29_9ZZZZ